MSDWTRKYVNVEFMGGPLDGDVRIFLHPPPPSWYTVSVVRPSFVALENEALPVTDYHRYEYRCSRQQHTYDILTASVEALARNDHKFLEYAMRKQRAMQYEFMA